MEATRQAQKKYGSRAMMAAILIGFAFILAGYKPLGKGLVLGALFSVINFVLIGEFIPLKLARSKGKTFLFAMLSILFRYVLMAVPLVAAIKYEQFHLVTTIAGLFAIQLVILGEHLFRALGPSLKKAG